MIQVFASRWLSQGWRIMDEKDSIPMAMVWIKSLDKAGVPYHEYERLYERSVQLRARRIEAGLKTDDFSVDMMLACWRELSKEIERERIESGRYLPETAASDCPRCFGSGMEVVEGKGARPCRHEPCEVEDRSPNPDAVDAVVEVIQHARQQENSRPQATTARGILSEAIIAGGKRETLLNALSYVRKTDAETTSESASVIRLAE